MFLSHFFAHFMCLTEQIYVFLLKPRKGSALSRLNLRLINKSEASLLLFCRQYFCLCVIIAVIGQGVFGRVISGFVSGGKTAVRCFHGFTAYP